MAKARPARAVPKALEPVNESGTFEATIEGAAGTRIVRVSSEAEAQVADAAADAMQPEEGILSVRPRHYDGKPIDGCPPRIQASEFPRATPGAASLCGFSIMKSELVFWQAQTAGLAALQKCCRPFAQAAFIRSPSDRRLRGVIAIGAIDLDLRVVAAADALCFHRH